MLKKIIISLLVLLTFWIWITNAWSEKKIIEKYDWQKSYQVAREIRELVNKYYYAIIFEKNDEKEIYWNIEKKLVKYNKISKRNVYSKEAKIKDFLDNSNNQEIINTLWYHTIQYSRYNDYSKNSSLFNKEHTIDLSNIKLNNKIEWLYLWIKIDEFEKKDRYNYNLLWKLKSVYTKYDKNKNIHFNKVNLDKYTWKIKINILKIKKEINFEKSYKISLNFYLKKWNNYIALVNSNIIDIFSFDKYTIKDSFSRKYREETNPRGNYYWNNNSQERLEVALNNKLKTIFDKIKSKKTEKEYILFLEGVKGKIINFSSDREKYDNLVKDITNNKTFNIAYKKYKKYKDQEKIINILLVFISNEIYENTLEDTISDFIN